MTERTLHHPSHKWAWYDFNLETASVSVICSECKEKIPKGQIHYVSRLVRSGAIAKRVCSEQCGQEFDLREMEARANDREDSSI